MDLILKHGGYRNLKGFQVAQVVYDLTSLLTRQITSLEKAFVEEGGFTERMYRVRSARRNRS